MPVPAAMQRGVLAVLLTRANQVVARDELADILWDGRVPASAAATLTTYVARLRRVLGPHAGARLRTVSPGYLIEVADHEYDGQLVLALERRAREAAQADDWQAMSDLAGKALALWRGEPYGDIPIPCLHTAQTPVFEAARLRLEELRVTADLRLGRPDVAITALRSMLAEHPLRERLYEQLMAALVSEGRRGEAFEVYQHACCELREQLGVDPGPELVAAYHAALETPEPTRPGNVPKGAAPSILDHQFPTAPRRFIGRERELAEVTAAMAGNEAPVQPGLTLLVGMPGVGKTALAVTWAHANAAQFPDGRLYLDLKGFAEECAPVSTDEAVRILLDFLGVSEDQLPATPQGRVALYRATVADKRLLIILDNARDADQVRPLLPTSGAGRVLATSRSTLASLVSIDFARTVRLRPFTTTESRELLRLRLGPERVQGHECAIAEIAEHCAHLPLALIVAAGRAWTRPDMSLEALAAQLRSADGSLGALDGGDAAINVRTVLSWSYRQLSAQTARVFRQLSLHPGPDITLAEASCLTRLPRAVVQSALVELAAMNMVDEELPGHYSFHSLLRAFAAEQVTEEERAEGVA